MPNGCVFCGNPHFNFGDGEEGVEMWINEPNDGEHVIVVDPPYAWSIPIGTRGQAMRATTDYVLNRKAIQHYLIDRDLT